MHPAYSVIFFTTSSGAGYGLLVLLGLAAAFGLLPPDQLLGFVTLGLSFALISAGLLSSVGHLGRPERAWRAFSQWRTSWLSREGVISLATFAPMGIFGIGWVFLGRNDGAFAIAGLLAALGALLTVACTAMIYGSLKPIPEWRSRFTLPAYLLFAVMTGSALLAALAQLFGVGRPMFLALALGLTIAGGFWKWATWRHNDALAMPASRNAAIGVRGGTVHTLEWPHTVENYILKEMGFRIARKHAAKLRRIAFLLAFALPALLLALALLLGPSAATWLAVIAVPIQLAGMGVERWLFFAEARHTAASYYI